MVARFTRYVLSALVTVCKLPHPFHLEVIMVANVGLLSLPALSHHWHCSLASVNKCELVANSSPNCGGSPSHCLLCPPSSSFPPSSSLPPPYLCILPQPLLSLPTSLPFPMYVCVQRIFYPPLSLPYTGSTL